MVVATIRNFSLKNFERLTRIGADIPFKVIQLVKFILTHSVLGLLSYIRVVAGGKLQEEQVEFSQWANKTVPAYRELGQTI